ncbi:MAG: hypothetical protein U0836_11395 [Pirellulales bacterium]
MPDFQGVVYVASNDPASPSSLVYRFTAADGGTHTFNPSVRLMTVGEQSVTISAPFLPSVTQTVTVAPAVVRLGISAPVAVNAGEAFQVTVSAINALGGRSADYTSTIHFTAADVQAGLPADYTFTADDAGSHTFTATLRTAGSRVVQATEVGGSVFGRHGCRNARRGLDPDLGRRRRRHRRRAADRRRRTRRVRQHGDRLQRHGPCHKF